jgi:hypothetical protein
MASFRSCCAYACPTEPLFVLPDPAQPCCSRSRHISPERIANLPSWRESALYSRAECAALAYCEILTQFDQVRFAAAHDAAAMLFDPKEIADIAAVVINMNVWTCLKLAQRAIPVATCKSV